MSKTIAEFTADLQRKLEQEGASYVSDVEFIVVKMIEEAGKQAYFNKKPGPSLPWKVTQDPNDPKTIIFGQIGFNIKGLLWEECHAIRGDARIRHATFLREERGWSPIRHIGKR